MVRGHVGYEQATARVELVELQSNAPKPFPIFIEEVLTLDRWLVFESQRSQLR